MKTTLKLLCLLVSGVLNLQAAEDMVFRLPTDNDALYRGDNEGYFMYCDRWFEGKHSRPWQAGSYGFTRNELRISETQTICTKLHEGIDVKSIKRDAKGEPLDKVRPIAPGVVAYVSNSKGASNYGRYVVLAHELPEGTIYTLYAHLSVISCEVGQELTPDDTLGILGYTGVGLNRVRAHCHLEICLMAHAEYHKFCPAANKHGLFNGQNLIGFNAADVLLACRDGQTFSLSAYFATLKEHYRVRVPYNGSMDLLKRHPFLYKGDWGITPPALDIAFTAEGVPIAVYPATEAVQAPQVISCTPKPYLQKHCTANRINGNSKTAALTSGGKTFISRFLWVEPQPSPPVPEQPQQTP